MPDICGLGKDNVLCRIHGVDNRPVPCLTVLGQAVTGAIIEHLGFHHTFVYCPLLENHLLLQCHPHGLFCTKDLGFNVNAMFVLANGKICLALLLKLDSLLFKLETLFQDQGA